MEKPLSMMIEETKHKLAQICNESGLHICVLDLVMDGLRSEIHHLAERQTLNEKELYLKSLEQELKSDFSKESELGADDKC